MNTENTDRHVKIFDTTLRDGEQSPGFSMDEEDKQELAQKLEEAGVDVIEAGFPIASEGDFRAVKNIAESVGRKSDAVICGLARAMEKDVRRAGEAVKGARRSRIHTFIGATDLRLKKQYVSRDCPDGISRETAVDMVRNAVRIASGLADEVEFSAEDATRTDLEFLKQVYAAAVEEGAFIINVPDTVGADSYVFDERSGMYIQKFGWTIGQLSDFFGESVTISTHCHNDKGLATANTIAGVLNGAGQVHVTINGIGERAGNASMEEVLQNLHDTGRIFRFDRKHIAVLSGTLNRITQTRPQPNKPIVGVNAFAHEAGIHQDGVLKSGDMEEEMIYEVVHPEDYGFNRDDSLVLGKHSGAAAVDYKLRHIGIELDRQSVKKLSDEIKAWADANPRQRGLTTEGLQLMVAHNPEYKILGAYEFSDYNVSQSNGDKRVHVTMNVNGVKVEEESIAGGLIEAGVKAMRKLMNGENYKMGEFRVISEGGGEDAVAVVSVDASLEDQIPGEDKPGEMKQINHTVTAYACHTDLNRASLMCFVNAVNQLESKKRALKAEIKEKE
jgi:2-isopropylmalate synthase